MTLRRVLEPGVGDVGMVQRKEYANSFQPRGQGLNSNTGTCIKQFEGFGVQYLPVIYGLLGPYLTQSSGFYV